MALQFKGGRAVVTDDFALERLEARSVQAKAAMFIKDAYGGVDNARERASFLHGEYASTGVVNVTEIQNAMAKLREAQAALNRSIKSR